MHFRSPAHSESNHLTMALGFFAVGQFAVKIKPYLIWPNLTFLFFSYGELSYSEKTVHAWLYMYPKKTGIDIAHFFIEFHESQMTSIKFICSIKDQMMLHQKVTLYKWRKQCRKYIGKPQWISCQRRLVQNRNQVGKPSL